MSHYEEILYDRWRKKILDEDIYDLLNENDYERLAQSLIAPERLWDFTGLYDAEPDAVERLLSPEQKKERSIDGGVVRLALLEERKRFTKRFHRRKNELPVKVVLHSAERVDRGYAHKEYRFMPSVKDALEDILREKFDRMRGNRRHTEEERDYTAFNERVQSKPSTRAVIKELKTLESMLH